jgi:hypothetical protein
MPSPSSIPHVHQPLKVGPSHQPHHCCCDKDFPSKEVFDEHFADVHHPESPNYVSPENFAAAEPEPKAEPVSIPEKLIDLSKSERKEVLADMKKTELQDVAEQLDVPVSGSKAELASAINQAIEKESAA